MLADLSKLTLKDVVRKMSSAGIIIAAHGAALVNSIFLPQVSSKMPVAEVYAPHTLLLSDTACCGDRNFSLLYEETDVFKDRGDDGSLLFPHVHLEM